MATGSPDWSPRIVTSGSGSESLKSSVTDVETEAEFSRTVLSFLVYNDGPYAVHVSRAPGVDTDEFKVPSGSWMMIDVPSTKLYMICASGKTATCYIIGIF